MSHHTPGPWNYAKSDFNDDRYSIYHNGPIAYCGENGCGPENALANARLIAAAPELLEALRGIIWKLSHNFSPSGRGGDCRPSTIDRTDATIIIALAAIAKAEGR